MASPGNPHVNMAQAKSLAGGTALASRPSAALRIQDSHKISSRGRSSTGTQALFGFGGGNKEEREWKRQEKEAAYQAQLDVLKRRKSGAWQKDVAERRGKVRRYNEDPEYKKEVDADKRARAEALRKADPPVTLFDIVIPIAPFGIPEYDLGERFDLKGPYCDSGYVDEEADFKKQFARFFGIGKKKQKPGDEKPPQGKKR